MRQVRQQRSRFGMAVMAGVVAGCTAIIDGAMDPPGASDTEAHGSRSGLGNPSTGAGGNRPASAMGDGGANEAGAESGGPTHAAGAETTSGGALTSPSAGEGGVASAAGGNGGASGPDSAGPSNGGASSGGDDAGSPSGDAGAGPGDAGASFVGAGGAGPERTDGPPPLLPGDPTKGHKLVILDNCYRCHGDNLAGRGFYRNITPDLETGIGAWTDKQIATAVRGAVGPNGEIFCAAMPLYSGLKDQEVADLIAYLRLIPAVKNLIVPVCPGHNP